MDADEAIDLVNRARAGERQAWETIVNELSNLVWSTVRGFRLPEAQAADAVQTTWLRLVEHLHAIKEPARIAGWVRTTCRRVCLEILRESRRADPLDTQDEHCVAHFGDDETARPEWSALQNEDVRLVRDALRTLDERDQALLALLSSPEQPSYQTISARLGMPIGSIGPTRARALTRLRAALETVGLVDLAS